MTTYLALKLVHIVSATVLFGTGLGSAFFMFRAWRSGSDAYLRDTARNVVLADWLFTMPSVVVQFVTGLWLTRLLEIPLTSHWFIAVVVLYAFVGACWLPVLRIQIRIRDLTASGAPPSTYAVLMRTWVVLGVLAFGAVLVIFFLMVTKVGAWY